MSEGGREGGREREGESVRASDCGGRRCNSGYIRARSQGRVRHVLHLLPPLPAQERTNRNYAHDFDDVSVAAQGLDNVGGHHEVEAQQDAAAEHDADVQRVLVPIAMPAVFMLPSKHARHHLRNHCWQHGQDTRKHDDDSDYVERVNDHVEVWQRKLGQGEMLVVPAVPVPDVPSTR